jgi:cytochrome P450
MTQVLSQILNLNYDGANPKSAGGGVLDKIIHRDGILPALAFVAGMARDPLARMRRMGLEGPSVHALSAGFPHRPKRKIIYMTGGENVRPIYLDTDTFRTSNVPLAGSKGGAQSRLRRGLIGSQGAEHRHYRASFIAQTGPAMMKDFAMEVAAQADAWVGRQPKDRPVDLVAFVNDLFRHYAVVTMYKEDNPEFALDIGREITAWIELGYKAGNILAPFSIPGMPHARYRDKAEDIEDKILKWAESRRGMDAKRDLLSMFVNGPDENGKPLTDDRLTGQILTLYAASFSSSVAGLIWTVFLLTQHPETAHALCDELEGSGIDPLSDGMKLLELPLLDRVLKESMRLCTPVPYQVRRVSKDAEASGLDLRARDIVVIGAWATNRLKSVYQDAEKFIPDRWFGMNANSYDYLTFSAGPRRCVGHGLAMIMLKITLATILLKRRPCLVPDSTIDTQVAVTLRPRKPIPVVFADKSRRFERAAAGGTITRLYQL